MYPEGQEILIVIDDGERRERVTRILGDEGFAVTAAAEGLAALRAVGAQRFAMVVAAARLPGSLDGATTVRQARTRQPWLKALFIDESNIRHNRGNPDIDDFIAAPFERHEFIGCIFELLQRGASEARDLSLRARTELRAS
jgi:two-component system phosphate regulon response regulator OmpR